MSQIIVSAKELNAKKESLSALKKKLEEEVKKFDTRVKKLGTMWEGQAQMDYANAVKLDMTTLAKFIQIIIEFISVLMTIIKMYEDMEKKNSATANS